MSLIRGFEKQASFMEAASGVGKALAQGAKASGGQTIGNALKLKGLSHISEAVGQHGGISKALTTQAGREAVARGVGKAAPSLAVAGAGAVAAKKVYNAATKDNSQQYYQG